MLSSAARVESSSRNSPGLSSVSRPACMDAGFALHLAQQKEMLLIVAKDALAGALDAGGQAADLGHIDAAALAKC